MKKVLPLGLGLTGLALAAGLTSESEVDGLEESNLPLPAAIDIADLKDAFIHQCEKQSRRDMENPANIVLTHIVEQRTEIAEQVGCTDSSVWTCGTPMTPAPHPKTAQGIPQTKTSIDCPEEDPFDRKYDLVTTK